MGDVSGNVVVDTVGNVVGDVSGTAGNVVGDVSGTIRNVVWDVSGTAGNVVGNVSGTTDSQLDAASIEEEACAPDRPLRAHRARPPAC